MKIDKTTMAALTTLALSASIVLAQDKYSSGAITWDTTTNNVWATSSGGTYDQPFVSGDNAIFEGTPGSELFGEDENGDGVTNGLAFLLGAADPTADATGLLPTVTEDGSGGLVLTFTMLDSASRGTAALSVEHSGDLGDTDPWAAALVPDTSSTVSGVGFVVTGGPGTLNVVATVPESGNTVDDNLFGRVSATE